MTIFVARTRRAKQTPTDRFLDMGGVITICSAPDGKAVATATLGERSVSAKAGNAAYAFDNLRRAIAFEERRYQNASVNQR